MGLCLFKDICSSHQTASIDMIIADFYFTCSEYGGRNKSLLIFNMHKFTRLISQQQLSSVKTSSEDEQTDLLSFFVCFVFPFCFGPRFLFEIRFFYYSIIIQYLKKKNSRGCKCVYDSMNVLYSFCFLINHKDFRLMSTL